MFLLIFESIGTSELILIGIIALIFLGPRKMPEIARKMGKIMADFRNTTNEFKQTWEREVNFEEETKALKEMADLNADEGPLNETAKTTPGISAPEVKAIDSTTFGATAGTDEVPIRDADAVLGDPVSPPKIKSEQKADNSLSDKKDWL